MTGSRSRVVTRGGWVRLVVVGLLVLQGGVALATAASTGAAVDDLGQGVVDGALSLRLVDVPVGADERERLYITDHVVPGARVERRIAIGNGTDEELPVALGAAVAEATDGWVLRPELEPGPTDLASWISIEPAELLLAPGEEALATVVVAVPGDAPGGEQYAAALATPPAVDGGGGVGVVNSVGLRIYLSVAGDPGAPDPVSDFEIDTFEAGRDDDGVPYVDVGVTNTGARAVDVVGEVELADEAAGLTAGPFPTAIGRTLVPGASGEVRVPLDPTLPAGPWDAVARMRSGDLERAAGAVVRFPEGSGDVGDPVDATGLRPSPGLVVPLGGGLALTVLGLVLLLRRRSQDDDEEEGPPAAGDDAPVVGAS